jgi:hypothetical protein
MLAQSGNLRPSKAYSKCYSAHAYCRTRNYWGVAYSDYESRNTHWLRSVTFRCKCIPCPFSYRAIARVPQSYMLGVASDENAGLNVPCKPVTNRTPPILRGAVLGRLTQSITITNKLKSSAAQMTIKPVNPFMLSSYAVGLSGLATTLPHYRAEALCSAIIGIRRKMLQSMCVEHLLPFCEQMKVRPWGLSHLARA